MAGQNFTRTGDERRWQSGQAGDLDAVAAAGRAGLDLAQEDDALSAIFDRDLEILDAW